MFQFGEASIAHLNTLEKYRTAETYATSLNSFKRYRNNRDILLEDIDSDIISSFEVY